MNNLCRTCQLKDLKKGDLFLFYDLRLQCPKNVFYVRNHYVRDLRKYSISRYDDINSERFLPGSTLVCPID